jgi:hypothetical protein
MKRANVEPAHLVRAEEVPQDHVFARGRERRRASHNREEVAGKILETKVNPHRLVSVRRLSIETILSHPLPVSRLRYFLHELSRRDRNLCRWL